jgi:phospholipid/cholesterol/gamma-HCH transport system substrate-binding protein
MVDRKREFQIGLMVIGATAALFVLAILFAKDDIPFFSERGRALPPIEFETAPGITPGSPVYKSGVLIGRVEEVRLVNDSSGVEVYVQLEGDNIIYQHETPHLVRDLLGDSRIEFVWGEYEGEKVEVKSDSPPLQGVTTVDPMQFVGEMAVKIETALDSVTEAGNKMGTVLDNVNVILGAGNPQSMQARIQQIDELLATTSDAMESFSVLAQGMEQIIGDPVVQENLHQALIDLPESMDKILVAIESASESMGEISEITGPFADKAAGIASNLDSSAAKLELIAENVLVFTDALAQGDGTIGRLVNDPEIYDRLNRSARNIEQLTVEAKPVLDDARVLMSELRRDPGAHLGARSLFNPGGGTSSAAPGYIAPPVYDNRVPRGSWDSPPMTTPAPYAPPYSSSIPRTTNSYGVSNPTYPARPTPEAIPNASPPLTAAKSGTGADWTPAPR